MKENIEVKEHEHHLLTTKRSAVEDCPKDGT